MSLRVLVVEDEPFIRMNLVDAMRSAGVEADEACDAAEALGHLNSSSFDIVLSDVAMPGPFDGRELANRIRRQWPMVRVVLMSGNFDVGNIPDDIVCIRKPFSIDSLVARLSDFRSKN